MIQVAQCNLTETLCEGRRARVCRGCRIADGLPVILKFPKRETTAEDLARFRHEFALLSKAAVPGVIKAYGLEESQDGPVMILEDIGGGSLDRVTPGTIPPLPQFLDLAIGLAATLASLHQRRIVHKAICPAHIVLNPQTGQFRLIGFGQADELPQLTVTFQPPAAFEGDLAYVSPEHTGRMNRPVDYRTDFYSLGVTFYQLLTGKPPFQAEDALGLIHCHIAAIPVSLHELNPVIPQMLSRIVLKLMAKMAEDRYQSALGLQADLERCRRELQEHGSISDFEPGERDFSEQLQVSQKLYGREKEVEQLLRAFDRVRNGERELLLVAGYAGVGKTALVHEIRRPILEAKGYFIEGKFDQLQRTVPYSACIQAFTALVNYLLMDNETLLAQWKRIILQAVGDIGRVLTDVIPNLELILGPQPEIPALGATEARNRLTYVFSKFIQALAAPDHPLVVFLDDLQWIDSASLNLVQILMTAHGTSGLLVIGAYRDNDVDALHPLNASIEALRKEQASITRIILQPLSEPVVNQLLAETLHTSLPQTRPITHLVCTKTGGNPFFLLQTLTTLVDQGAILFNATRLRWEWDMPALENMKITDNVVALMLARIQQLPLAPQQILPLAACIGFRFDSSTLGMIAEQSEESVVENLQPAIREGLILSQDRGFQFAHDRIQQAAYSLIPEADRGRVHLRIGRLLLKHTAEDDREEQLFTIVDLLNFGAELIRNRDEKLDLARLNLRAGSKARESAAFSAATKYFEAGVALLDEQSWETDYALDLGLYTQAAEAESLVGQFERTDRLFDCVVHNAKTAEDMVGVYDSEIHSYISQGKLKEAVDRSLECFERLGLHLPGHPTDEDIALAIKETKSLYAHIPIEDLINLPKMTDPNKLAILHIHKKSGPAAYISRPAYVLIQMLSQVSVCIKYGNADDAPNAYATYALFLCGFQRAYDEGYRFAKLGLALLDIVDSSKILPKTMCMIGGHAWHFRHHVKESLPYLEKGYQEGLKTGDFENAAYDAEFCCTHSYFAGVELQRVEQLIEFYGESVRQIRVETAAFIIAPYWQAVKNLLSTSGDPCALVGKKFNQEELLPVYEQKQNRTALAAFYVNRLMLCYLFEQYEQAFESAELAEQHKGGMLSMVTHCVSIFYDSLARIQVYPHKSPHEQAQILERVSTNQQTMKGLADSAPMNFLHKFYLVEAECMRLTGQGMAALDYYDKAISLARDNEYIQEAALSNELAARFCSDKGKVEFARVYMKEAYRCYDAWGAVRKTKDLEQRYSYLCGIKPREETTGSILGLLDLSTLMKAMNAISRQIEMEKLLSEVLHCVIENAGAQSGSLLLEREGKWIVAAQQEVESSRLKAAEASDPVAMGAVHFVARTKERVVLEDAARGGALISDPHIQREQTKSLLCAPLLNRGRLVGILYLENNLATHAFTPERVELLEMLLSQAATSLENAGVYQVLKESEEKYRRIVDTASEGIWVLGREMETTFVNAYMAKMLGCETQEMLGKQASDFMYEYDWPNHLDRMRERASRGAERYERRFRHKDGRTIWTLISATPIYDDAGRFGGTFAMVADITDRKRAEDALHELNRDLEQRVLERTVLLDAANKELEAFAYSVSHDLRAPLRHIDGFVNLLRERAATGLDEKSQHYMTTISDAAKRAGQLIEDLLSFSRMSRAEMADRPVDLDALAREVIQELASDAAGRTVDWQVGKLPVVSGDQPLLRVVLVNLLSNALKFTRSRERAQIEIGSRGRPTETEVFVRDNGVGFDMLYVDKLFGVFQRLHSSREFEGTGIGLANVRRVIERHGGRTWAEGKRDEGATFYFSIPHAKPMGRGSGG